MEVIFLGVEIKLLFGNISIARCADDSLYTGITTDVRRREKEHNTHDVLGAKSLRGKRPIVMIHQEQLKTRSEATKREAAIKRMNRAEKLQLLADVS